MNTYEQVQLKESVMRRVYAVWFVKRVLSPTVFELAALGLIVAWLKEFVSIRHVIANAPSLLSPASNAVFLKSAFFHAEPIVQLLVFGALVTGFLFAKSLMKAYSFYLSRNLLVRA